NVPMEVQISDGATPPNITKWDFTVTSKSTPPSFTSETPAFGVVTVVAAQGNPTINGTSILATLNAADTANGEVNITFNVSGAFISGVSQNGSLTVVQGTTALAPTQNITATTQTVGPLLVLLPPKVSTPVTVTLT